MTQSVADHLRATIGMIARASGFCRPAVNNSGFSPLTSHALSTADRSNAKLPEAAETLLRRWANHLQAKRQTRHVARRCTRRDSIAEVLQT